MRDPERNQGLVDWLLACPEKGFSKVMEEQKTLVELHPMTTIQLTLPSEVFASLRRSPHELETELRLAAAMHWYSRGKISQERAAQLAGLDHTDFLLALAREEVDAFRVDLDALRRELDDG